MPLPSPIEKLDHPLFRKYKINVVVKRDDLIHPIISGNKWRKLQGNIKQAQQQHYKGILSFGGAYSNHIHSLAYACQQQGLFAHGIIRGESHYQNNATLSQAKKWGLTCEFVDRQTYRLRNEQNYLEQLTQQYPDYFIVPEGGSNQYALTGMADVITELNQQLTFDHLITPVGSGGTIAGLIKADNNQHKITGITVLKEAEYLVNDINKLLGKSEQFNNWQLLTNFHGGGYAKFSQQALTTLEEFNQAQSILFEPVYSGKMLLGFLELVTQGYFQANDTIVLLHTGGLQGINGLLERNKLSSNKWQTQVVPLVD